MFILCVSRLLVHSFVACMRVVQYGARCEALVLSNARNKRGRNEWLIMLVDHWMRIIGGLINLRFVAPPGSIHTFIGHLQMCLEKCNPVLGCAEPFSLTTCRMVGNIMERLSEEVSVIADLIGCGTCCVYLVVASCGSSFSHVLELGPRFASPCDLPVRNIFSYPRHVKQSTANAILCRLESRGELANILAVSIPPALCSIVPQIYLPSHFAVKLCC